MQTDQARGNDEFASGFQFLRNLQEQQSAPAPFERMLGFRLQRVSEGEVELVANPVDECANPMGTVHGGYFAALLDAAMGASAHSLLSARHDFTTVDLKVSFMKALRNPFTPLRALGWVRRPGKRVMFVEGQIYSNTNELIAAGTATCLIWERPIDSYSEVKDVQQKSKT